MKPTPLLSTIVVLLAIVIGHPAYSASSSSHHFEIPQESYVNEAFEGTVPAIQRVWIKGNLKQQIEAILQHRVSFLRVKYWQNDGKSVWILEERGKDQLITVGVTVLRQSDISSIDNLRVLAYRESRGWEVKHAFFTEQFNGSRLQYKGTRAKLDKSIDGITGATLSVRALTKVARIALLLDAHVRT